MAALGALLEPGRPWPLGAHLEREGVNFALFSAHAERVELCLLDDAGELRLDLPACTDQVWQILIAGDLGHLACVARCTIAVVPQRRG